MILLHRQFDSSLECSETLRCAHAPATSDGVLRRSGREHLLDLQKRLSLGLDHDEAGGHGPDEVERGVHEVIGVDAKRLGDGGVGAVQDERAAGQQHDAQRGRLGLDVGREHLAEQRVRERAGAERVRARVRPQRHHRPPRQRLVFGPVGHRVQAGAVRGRHQGHRGVRHHHQRLPAHPVHQDQRHQVADALDHGEHHDGHQRVHPVAGGRQRDRAEVYELRTEKIVMTVRSRYETHHSCASLARVT